MLDFWDIFTDNLSDTTWMEFVAVILGIASVWYARRENILVYPTGIVSVLIFVFICFNARLYADAGINLFYFGMSVYGWYNWTRPAGNSGQLAISVNSLKQQWTGIGLTVISYWAILGLIWLFNYDDTVYMQSYVPWTDSFTTSVFLVGMLLMARKKVENWAYWIIGDVISIPLYFMKGLVFTSFQYLVFLIIAVMGLIEWRRRYRNQQLQ
ncbi:Nicotinamide riboside transporter PnuC [bioreactor metagenome]|jgi:nicotinamide mononucleotide transporter|uniref:Nicotinamide riboside transporter PnuC n=1 Tax=bioreactor metagenome TaxID=1076179 RepID=A0A644VAV5_9ZZZZ|nr:nicotinamide riboside transporter PnuC [Lentimicrobium sp.]MEA5111353.1 nicotinamide riboside transporter PnuC [Lentimicrobium sp.]HCT71558.1 nicotinamide mononucleotide transporter [Bacteroidales bacterium]